MKSESEILARLQAIEFLVENLYVTRLKEDTEPQETARVTQSMATVNMSNSVAAESGNDARTKHVFRASQIVNEFFERVVKRLESP